MLTNKVFPHSNIETDSTLFSRHYPSQSSLISSSTISSIDKVENSHVSRVKLITRAIKATANSIYNSEVKKITRSPAISRSESSRLIGMSIHPHIAAKYQNKIDFDGVGEIKSLKLKNIDRKDYNILINNIIKPLRETPQLAKEIIRTPGEAIINIAGIIKKAPAEMIKKRELEEVIQKTWLDGALSRQSLHNMAELIKIKIKDHPQLINEIDNILYSLENNFFITKRNDNYYGRLFETELSKFILDNPNINMLKVRDTVVDFILEDFKQLSKYDQESLCHCLAARMDADPPAWRAQLFLADKFINEHNPKNFIEMLKCSGSYSVPLVLSTAVKYIISSLGTVELKNKATEYYINKILPQRQLINSLSDQTHIRSSAYGLLLPYQNNYLLNNNNLPGKGIRPIDKYMRPTVGVEINEHDAIALSNEKTIGIGVSGSSNILNFLFKQLQLQHEDFPEEDARLATASWLSYSGGHSFNEAYSVFGFMSPGNFEPLSFNELKNTNPLSEIAISHAYNKVVATAMALNSSSCR